MILPNYNGAIIFAAYRALFSCGEALEAELSTCMEGLLFSIQRSELPIIVEMDSMVEVKVIQSHEIGRSL